jgi:hypothetical protein
VPSLLQAQIVIVGGIGNSAYKSVCGIVRLFDPSETTYYKKISILAGGEVNATDGMAAQLTYSSRASTSVVNALQFYMSSGNIAAGTFKLYGVVT